MKKALFLILLITVALPGCSRNINDKVDVVPDTVTYEPETETAVPSPASDEAESAPTPAAHDFTALIEAADTMVSKLLLLKSTPRKSHTPLSDDLPA